jgi:hypothetical protein
LAAKQTEVASERTCIEAWRDSWIARTELERGGVSEHAEHAEPMPGLPNTLPRMTGTGPFGPIEMGGVVTVVKIRENLASYDEDPGWYEHRMGTGACRVSGPSHEPPGRGHEHQGHEPS